MGREDDFETRYEQKLARQESQTKKTKLLLPTKSNGKLKIQEVEEEDEEEIHQQKDEAEKEGGEELEFQDDDQDNEEGLIAFAKNLKIGNEREHENKILSTAMLISNRRHKVAEYKMKIGIMSASFLEDPENRIKNMDSLLAMLQITDPAIVLTVPKYAAVSLCAVFMDVLPSYSITHHNTPGIRLKSETKERQTFEVQILKRYKIYLQRLEKFVSRHLPRKKPANYTSAKADAKLGKTALSCMSQMLISHPYFNMSTNIANFVVPFLDNWDDEIRKLVRTSLQTLFKSDKRGEMSYEIVRRINNLMKTKLGKRKTGHIRRDALDVLLSLRIKEADLEKEKVAEMKPNGKITFEQRKMLSKKERKKSKEMLKLEKELLEVSAEENKTQKSKHLTEITKLVFTIYFRALKSSPQQDTLTAVLEGLAKFAHIINIEYFEDLLKVLQQILSNEHIHEHQRLLCVATVLAVLDGHGAALTLDPIVFHKHLYTAINRLRCGKPESDAGLALRCVRLAVGRSKMPGPRAVAFAKRLATASTQLEHHDSLGALVELKHLLRVHPATSGLLDTDGASANGIYLPELDDPDHCCAQASTLWELATLSTHYHPWVRQVTNTIVDPQKITPLPKEIGQKRPEEICIDLNPYETMEFIPLYTKKETAVKNNKRSRIEAYQPKTDYFKEDNYLDESYCEIDEQSLKKIKFF